MSGIHIKKRPPVVAIMGHIDHGKSTLLSYIRKNAKPLDEAGGITQHISAYEVEHQTPDGVERITFLDTPGHAAFSGHRSRGVQTADIVILVVSAEDGVKPQTIEALNSIIDGDTPYIVAITKIDKPGANIDRTKVSLAENNIYVEGYGGDISVVAVSGKTGEGVAELLDLIILTASLEDLSGDSDSLGTGVIIESNLDVKKGISATCIIKNGTLSTGMYVASTESITPVRIMEDWTGKNLKTATFSSPIKLIGWNTLPKVGSNFMTFATKKEAEEYSHIEKKDTKKDTQEEDKTVKQFPIVLKADTGGSLEALMGQINQLANERITPKIIHSGIGALSENDIRGAEGSKKAVVICFNVKIDSQAKTLAERDGIEVVSFDIIYKLSEWLAEKLIEHTPKIETEEITGISKVLKVFSKIKDKQIIGCRMETGKILQGEQIKIFRRDAEIGTGRVRELQSQKVKVGEVEEGKEFGTMIEAKIEIAPGDKLQAVTMVSS